MLAGVGRPGKRKDCSSMAETNTTRATPAHDGQRWQSQRPAVLVCSHCRGAREGQVGVRRTDAGWVADWLCSDCGTTQLLPVADTTIWEWDEMIGPWSLNPATGGVGKMLP